MRYAMIMAGGAGTRLWPMSRPEQPKQLIPFIGGRSLLEVAAARLEGVVPPARRLVCTAERFRDQVRAAIPALGDEQILGEPEGRDTANAVGLTAAVLARRDPDATFAVLTADHLIEPVEVFRASMDLGFRLVEDDASRLVTFGIAPTHPATGFGYLERGDAVPGFPGAFAVRRFVEKPDRATAEGYLAGGRHLWNAGMFVFHARTFLAALKRHLPEAHEGLAAIAEAWDDPCRSDVLAARYPTLPKRSVDYAVMEPASSDPDLTICTVPMAVQWMDVGSWPAYGETLPADADGNRAATSTLHLDSARVVVASDDPSHLVATIGCRDLIIVHTATRTLVCAADQAQRVKELAERAGG